MMSTTLTRIGRSAKTPIATAVDRALAQQATSAFSTATLNHFSALQSPTTSTSANTFPIQIRTLSIQNLDMTAVNKIKAELKEVDANSDGRYARNAA
jgi:hypothetical protein